MSDELKQLEVEAVAVDAANAPPNPEAQAEQEQAAQAAQDAISQEAEIVGLLTITAALFTPMFPSLEAIYTQQTIQSIASAAVPVMQKHGWNAGSLLGKYGEEFALLAVLAPVGFATYKGVKSDIEKAEKAAKAEKENRKDGLTVEGSDAVTVEPVDMTPQPEVMARG